MPRPSKRKKRPPDKQTNAFLGKDFDYEGWKQIGKCDNMKFSKSLKIYEGIFKFYEFAAMGNVSMVSLSQMNNKM